MLAADARLQVRARKYVSAFTASGCGDFSAISPATRLTTASNSLSFVDSTAAIASSIQRKASSKLPSYAWECAKYEYDPRIKSRLDLPRAYRRGIGRRRGSSIENGPTRLTIKEGVMIFWLVLIVAGQVAGNENPHTPRIMHVGNYSSYAACEKSAAGYTTPVKLPNNPPQITMLCIQANETGRTQAPPG